MPSHTLLPNLAEPHLTLEADWRFDGRHYQRTLEAWRERHEEYRNRILPIFRAIYGADAERWWQRWRMFFIACSELFGYRNGEEWGVSHYRFARRSNPP
jgi:cyclopropane-fatty-acyl-phospholipid synthase